MQGHVRSPSGLTMHRKHLENLVKKCKDTPLLRIRRDGVFLHPRLVLPFEWTSPVKVKTDVGEVDLAEIDGVFDGKPPEEFKGSTSKLKATKIPSFTEYTVSETIVERYLLSNGYMKARDFQHEVNYPGMDKRPDYSIWRSGQRFTYLLEVKQGDVGENKEHAEEQRRMLEEWAKAPNGFGGAREVPLTDCFTHPTYKLRKLIGKASEKFSEFESCTCVLIVYKNDDEYMRVDPYHLLASMEGNNTGVRIDFDKDMEPLGTRSVIDETGKMKSNGVLQNKRIQAIANVEEISFPAKSFYDKYEEVLAEEVRKAGRNLTNEEALCIKIGLFQTEDYERETVQRMIVVQNPYVADLDQTFLKGPYDERWEHIGGKFQRTYLGEAMKEQLDRI